MLANASLFRDLVVTGTLMMLPCDFCMNVFTELGPMKVDAATIFFQETLPE